MILFQTPVYFVKRMLMDVKKMVTKRKLNNHKNLKTREILQADYIALSDCYANEDFSR